MDECNRIRQAVSATIDGEDQDDTEFDVLHHLDRCTDCRNWQVLATKQARSLRIGIAEPVVDLAPAIMAALDARATTPSRVAGGLADPLTYLRGVLGGLAIAQLALGITQLIGVVDLGHAGHGDPAGGHLFNESAAWNIAIGAGFAMAAMRPRLARGLLPTLGIFVLILTGVSAFDLIAGNITPARVGTHLLVLAGALVLFLLERTARSSLPGGRAGAQDADIYATMAIGNPDAMPMLRRGAGRFTPAGQFTAAGQVRSGRHAA